MSRSSVVALCTALILVGGAVEGSASAGPVDAHRDRQGFSPGAPGAGDPYFPRDGNGGYDVRHYGLNLRYVPRTDHLRGHVTIRARATKNLSRFDLDLRQLRVRSVVVNGHRAMWTRQGQELRVTPRHGLRRGRLFTTRVRYSGVPRTLRDGSGFIHTDDGALVVGEPHVAASWFPVNDHPSDKASYSFSITVPRGRQVVANGHLQGRHRHGRWVTWHWNAKAPMASYLATASVGEWRFRSTRQHGIRIVDAIDPDLLKPTVEPRTGSRLAMSQKGSSAYSRLTRTLSVPASGGKLSFWVDRWTEPDWDFFLVEAHTAGQDDWTTLPDDRGHTSRDTGNPCPDWLGLHPFLGHYQTAREGGGCAPRGSTGSWHAATGQSRGYEHWTVDLTRYAGQDVEVSLSYVSDPSYSLQGVFVDDIATTTGEGTTSFERDGNVLDGWRPSGPPAGSPSSHARWIAGTGADEPPSIGQIAARSLRREGDILGFLAKRFGPYPFGDAGGVVDDVQDLGFALENQTRPIYASDFFTDRSSGDAVVVHELTHQWYGDSLSVRRWRDIWLNEGFATYAEWLWSKHEGRATPQEIFDAIYAGIPADAPFWSVRIGNPGPDALFDDAVYYRGGMTLQQLRNTVGSRAFFTILRRWAAQHRYGNVSTRQFIALAERVSGRQLDGLFRRWLFTEGRPEVRAASTPRPLATPSPKLERLLHAR